MENKTVTPELIENAKKAASPEELLRFAKENDFDITAEYAAQLFAKLHPNSAVLSDEELTNVAGGGCSSGECKCPRCGSTDLSYHGSYMDIYEKLECNSCRYDFLW